jgi:C1A family cysteine protease
MNRAFFKSGWIRQKTDHRDIQYKMRVVNVPPAFTSKNIGDIKDQGQLGSCTGHGGSEAVELVYKKEGHIITPLSPLFLYYWTRTLEGTVRQDSGCEVRDVFKAANKYGIAPEADWPYDIRKFKTKPVKTAIADALNFKALQYEAVPKDLNSIKNAVSFRENMIIGFDVFDSFFNMPATGIMPAPTGKLAGGHCVLVYGYDDTKQAVLCRNSWGPDWALKGDFWMPYDYLTGPHADDFWTVSLVGK